jgi:hypothetical protein
LVFELSYLVEQYAKLVRDIGNVIVPTLAPDGQLLLTKCQMFGKKMIISVTNRDFHSLPAD